MKFSLRGALAALLGLMASLGLPGVSRTQTVQLREKFPAGYQYHVSTRTELTGTLALPPEKNQGTPKSLRVEGSSVIEYDERVLVADGSQRVGKTIRICTRMDFQRKTGNELQASTLRPAVRRLVVLRHDQTEVPFSPDGPLQWSEIDLVRNGITAKEKALAKLSR